MPDLPPGVWLFIAFVIVVLGVCLLGYALCRAAGRALRWPGDDE